jgi:hypothetical protein
MASPGDWGRFVDGEGINVYAGESPVPEQALTFTRYA